MSMNHEKQKRYKKPELVYESFALSQDIASGCEGIANFAEGVCSVTVDVGFPMEIFQNPAVCSNVPPNPDDYVCYHAPSDGNNIFSS